jgi:hypothetical protein
VADSVAEVGEVEQWRNVPSDVDRFLNLPVPQPRGERINIARVGTQKTFATWGNEAAALRGAGSIGS